MGVYSANRTGLSDYDGAILEEYTHPYAALDLVYEAHVNSQRMFDAIITMDIQEAFMNHEGGAINEAEIESLQEGALADIWGKIVAFLKKVLDKIKSIVKVFTTKLGTIFSSNRDMVSKYSKQYWRNDTSKMKIKNYRKPTPWNAQIDVGWKYLAQDLGPKGLAAADDKALETLEDNLDDEVETAYGKIIGDSSKYTAAEFRKEFDEKAYDTPELLDGFSGSEKTDVEKTMKDTKFISEIEKQQRNVEKEVRTDLKKAETKQKEAVKDDPNNPNKDKSLEARRANYYYTCCTHAQTVVGTAFSCFIQAQKMYMAQCRRAYAMAVNYRKKKNESWDIDDFDGTDDQTLLDAIGESAAFEVESDFDQFAYEI